MVNLFCHSAQFQLSQAYISRLFGLQKKNCALPPNNQTNLLVSISNKSIHTQYSLFLVENSLILGNYKIFSNIRLKKIFLNNIFDFL